MSSRSLLAPLCSAAHTQGVAGPLQGLAGAELPFPSPQVSGTQRGDTFSSLTRVPFVISIQPGGIQCKLQLSAQAISLQERAGQANLQQKETKMNNEGDKRADKKHS